MLALRHVRRSRPTSSAALPQHRARLHVRAGERARRRAVVDGDAPVVPPRLRRPRAVRAGRRRARGAGRPAHHRTSPRRSRDARRPRRALAIGARVVVAFEDLAPGMSVPAFRWSPRERAVRRVPTRWRSSGTRSHPVERHAGSPLGAIALDTAKAAIADAGLDVAQIDGFTTGAHLPDRGRAHHRGRRQHRQRELDGRAPRRQPALGERLPGLRPDPGLGRAGGERGRERRRRLRAPAPRAAQPGRQVPRQPDARGARLDAVDGAAGILRSAGDDRAARTTSTSSATARRATRWRRSSSRRGRTGRGSRGRSGTTSRSPAEDYLAARGDRRSDLHVRLRHPGRRRGDVRLHLGRTRA